MTQDTITLLGSNETLGAKTHTPQGSIAYNAPIGPYIVRRIEISDLAAAAAILDACPHNAFLVRGSTSLDTIPYRRHKAHGAEPATLHATAHRLLPIDIDDEHSGLDGRDVEACARAHRALLPPAFHAAACFAQATSSAGVKPGSRIRLWFWCDREVSDRDAKTWLRGTVPDLSIYSPSQPIYCARPRFDGIPDPLEGRARSIMLPGGVVSVPADFAVPDLAPLQGFGTNVPTGVTGTRNKHLTSLAGSMRKRGMSADAMRAALLVANAEFPEPLPADEVDGIAASVATYAPETIAAPNPKSDVRAARKALKQAREVMSEDPGLLPRLASKLAGHVASGAISEGQAITALAKGAGDADVIHAHTREDIARALSAALPEPPTTIADWAAQCILSDEGNPVPCPENLRILLSTHPEIALWWNARAQVDVWEKCPWRAPGPVDGSDDFALRAWVSRLVGWHKCPAEPLAAIANIARMRPYDPWRAHMESLVWDGTPRVLDLAPRILGCEDAPVNRLMFAWWLLSAVARTFDPGCQVDHVLVLEGPQGIGKTSILRALAYHEAFFTRLVSGADLSSPRTIGKIHGPVIVEIAELAVLRRAEIEAVKAFVDERTDRVQWLYARTPVNVPRSCVFAATTNDSEYLRDLTGARRFWPIACGALDLAYVTENRDQIWAEVVHMYRAGVVWWPTQAETVALGLAEVQASRREGEQGEDAILDVLARTYAPGRQPMSLVEIDPAQLVDACLANVTTAQVCALANLHPARDARTVARVLKAHQWKQHRARDGGRSRVWTAPGLAYKERERVSA